MEVFVRNVPPHSSERQLKSVFQPLLAEFNITVFELNKLGQRPLATITVLDTSNGLRFLQKYGAQAYPPLVRLSGCILRCTISRNAPADIQLRTLAHEANRQDERQRNELSTQPPAHRTARSKNRRLTRFAISSLSCGVWTYVNDRLTFQGHFLDQRRGSIIFGARQAALLMQPNHGSADRIDINYYFVDTVLTGEYADPTLTFTLICPPKFYRRPSSTTMDALAAAMAQHNLNGESNQTRERKRRMPSINSDHQSNMGTCFVYRVHLTDHRDLPIIYQLVNDNRSIQSTMSFPTPMQPSYGPPLPQSMTRLNFEMTDESQAGALPFGLRFQICRLAQNGKLMPDQARALLPCVRRIYHQYGETPSIEAVRRFYQYLLPPGPHTEASDHTHAKYEQLLEAFAAGYNSFQVEDAYSISNRHAHIVLIHKINVTPAGVYLEGPSAEVTNRVLRQYPDHNSFFARVCFMDEDGESVRYNPKADQSEIYHRRFKDFINGTYNIAGRGFSFLGFSHSSLRSQTCWFMAPFTIHGSIKMATTVIRELGDFSAFRSPARCAARIGQAFTDTTGTVTVDAGMLARIPDVERIGRTFSDGCGTISQTLLERIWRVYATGRSLKPTILQIRFAGAKGVVSLDSRLQEDQLTIRPSMEKFRGSRSNQVEICGASFRPLPMILNRGYIKILEDLGIPLEVFMDLQTAAVRHLRMMTTSNINASILLTESTTSKTAQLPELLEHLSDVGLEYQSDPFLRDLVEMTVVTKLRDMKYRGRIPVRNGVTLYGIMDETGFLQGGQIYVVTEKPQQGGKQVLKGGRVIVTRSPALHPGDIRIVKAVDVPEDSPLSRLSNCVVFSQHGERDLPSQLSGGDLNGDLYNIIFDPGLMPRRGIAQPADYPRVAPIELDRAVNSKDMSDFFIQFMESDQLGQISTMHVQLADRYNEGVFHDDCI